MFLEQQVIILECFLKDHVTLKSNDAANLALQHRNKIHLKKLLLFF